jgi:hypothetical protein
MKESNFIKNTTEDTDDTDDTDNTDGEQSTLIHSPIR